MPKSVNRVELLGNVADEVKVKATQNSSVANITIATNRKYKKGDEYVEDAQFTRCVAWGKLAEIIGEYVTKGMKVYATGRLQSRSYEDQNDGTTRYITEVVLDEVIMLSSKRDENGENQSSKKQYQKSEETLESEEVTAEDGPLPWEN